MTIIKIDAKGVTKAKKAIENCAAVLKRIEGDLINGQDVPFKPEFSCFRLFLRTGILYGMLREVEAPTKRITTTGVWLKTRVPPQIEVTGTSTRPKGDGSNLKPRFNHAIAPPIQRHTMSRVERSGPSRLSLIGRIEDAGGYDAEYQLAKLRIMRELQV